MLKIPLQYLAILIVLDLAIRTHLPETSYVENSLAMFSQFLVLDVINDENKLIGTKIAKTNVNNTIMTVVYLWQIL